MASENGTEMINPGEAKSAQDTVNELLRKTIIELDNLNLSGLVTFDTPGQFIARGGYGEVYTGKYKSPDGEHAKVAIKRIRFSVKEGPSVIKIMVKELYLWPRLKHPNILPLRGFIVDETGFPSLISEWMENGSILEYARKHPGWDVIIHLTLGIAEGLAYLHGYPMVHSDIKSENILVSSTAGDAKICDFGITRAMNVSQVALQGNTTIGSTPRWTAYEMLDNPNEFRKHSKESDVWAFGMTLYELLAKHRPFVHLGIDNQVIVSLMRKELPARPASLDTWPKEKQGIWKICEFCWSFDPRQRIKIDDVVKEIKALNSVTSAGK